MKESSIGRKLVRSLWICIAAMGIMLFASVSVSAAQYTLPLTGAWKDGSIDTKGQANYYQFTLTKAGYVGITYQAWSLEKSLIELLDKDYNKLDSVGSVWGASSINPVVRNCGWNLEPGTYCIKVYGYYGSELGTYRIKGTFENAGNTEREPNNTFMNAMPLNANTKVKGYLTLTDNVDFYQMRVPQNGAVKVIYNGLYKAYINIYDKDYILQYNHTFDPFNNRITWTWERELAAGTYFIKISKYSDTGTYTLQYQTSDTKVTSVSISGAKSVTAGKTLALKASVSPASASNKSVSWKSSNTSIATVSGSGVVTALKPGEVTITATAKDGSGKKASCKIKVLAQKVTSISVTGNKSIRAGQTLTLKATVRPTNATNKAVSWKTSNSSVATVSSKGVVTARKAGTVVITATAKDGSGKKASCVVAVLPNKPSTKIASSSKGTAKLSWNRQDGVEGYQILYSTSSSFDTYSSITATSATATSKTLKSLKSKKAYYVKVRCFVTYGSKKYYGSWSTSQRVVVK